MPYITGAWGKQAKERSRRRHAYFLARFHATPSIKKRARWNLYHALRAGKITRPAHCEHCSQVKRLQAHHDSYEKPLEVKWYCGSCHRKLHKGGDEVAEGVLQREAAS